MRYMARRVIPRYLVLGFFTLFGITVLSFLLGKIAPGDPAYAILASDGQDTPTQEQLDQVRATLGLDKPIVEQYVRWVAQILQGNIGVSFMTNRMIETELALRLPVTLTLSLVAILLVLVISLPSGLLLALHKDSIADRVFLAVTSIFSALPSFLVALILIIVFAETLSWLPSSGLRGSTSLILPALSISLGPATQITRVLRADLLATFGEEYFQMARSKGFSFPLAAAIHALPNALHSVTSMWGNYFIGILGGSVVAEQIFALPGVGQWILKSINSHDYPAIQAYVLVMGVLCLIVFFIVDVAQLALEPKLRRA